MSGLHHGGDRGDAESRNASPEVGARVVIADDDELVRLLARSALEQDGFEVYEAEDGQSALDQIRRHDPHMVVLDVEMPSMSGFATCQAIRRDPTKEHTPVLMMTGHEDADSIDRAYHVGATDFITKPVNWLLLRHRLRYILRSDQIFWDLRESQARLANAQRIARMGNWSWDLKTGELEVSDEMLRIFELDFVDGIRADRDFLGRVHPTDRSAVEERFQQCRHDHQACSIEYRIVLDGARERYVLTEAHAVPGESGRVARIEGTSQDITDRRRIEAEIRHLAYHDGLTGLVNRSFFHELLTQSRFQARQKSARLALLFVDLDDFKEINDTLGHTGGDQLLKSVAERLISSTRRADCVGRLEGQGGARIGRFGGDEFTVLLTDVGDARGAELVARRVIERLAEPFVVQGQEVTVGASIGITLWPDDADEVDELLRNGDTAMYHAKRQGKNRFQFYSQSMNEESARRSDLERRLRLAIDRNQLCLVYQPIVARGGRRTLGVEALVRWNDPERGFVLPRDFIPFAETAGLVERIDEWVLENACASLRGWRAAGLQPGRLAVNVAARHFRNPGFAGSMVSRLEELGLAAADVEIDVPEGALRDDEASVAKVLEGLGDAGVRVVIDDFGIDYSCLRSLRSLPISGVRIAPSFVAAIDQDSGARELVVALVALGKSLAREVIAKGVGTEAQREILEQAGCDAVQGDGVGPPVPAEDLPGLLSDIGGGGPQRTR